MQKTINFQGRDLVLETGRVARQANGSVVIRYGDTVVLATATASKEPREGIDFFPLTVDYEERLYAVGKIPGGFIKREGRPSEKAILSARLIDRPIRPLFPKGFRNDVHIVATVLSVDQDNPPDVTAMVGVSAALAVSDIPFHAPTAAVLVGLIDGQLVINPTLEQMEKSDLHLVVAGTKEAIMMVEAGANEVSEEMVLEGILLAHENIKVLVDFIEDFVAEARELGLAKDKPEVEPPVLPDLFDKEFRNLARPRLEEALHTCASEPKMKLEREAYVQTLREELVQSFLADKPELEEEYPDCHKLMGTVLDELEKELMRKMILKENLRVDGRKTDEIRPITCEVGILPRTHGTGLFTRGETQVLTVATLGAVSDEQILDGLGVEESKRYMHHYNFPPYSVGEARPMRGPGRREIGHGALAERALETVLPSEEDFPYTIRLVSEVLGSNGSTSMGSVCGSTLALMDAGVPIRRPVAGVAMGLIKEEEQVAVLTDIQGVEDALGDMDFKVAGTVEGITALQMDIKVAGTTREILQKALEQARVGRLHILDKMLAVLAAPRPQLSPYAPRIIQTSIDPDKIRDIIGPGGKIIKKIIEETGAEIDIEDDGRIFIAAAHGEGGEKALRIIESITKDVEVGQVYVGKVTRVTDFGAFVEVIPGVIGLPGKEGLVHISQLAERRVEKVEDEERLGDEILVKAIGFDHQGRLKLSRKEALREQKQKQ
ncbi:MAG: polyribonucleotide nucleotidyltransferase [Clostridia bacterium]|nr:polyribonucleotide nucleotidyltransferase [Clostridia bacterium]